MNHANKLSGLIAIAAAAAMPLAFAQTTPTTDDGMQQPPQSTPQTAAPTAEPKQVTWADLDVNKDGSLSKEEVTTVPELSQVFDEADANGDGKLTAEEYKAHAAGNAGGAADDGATDE